MSRSYSHDPRDKTNDSKPPIGKILLIGVLTLAFIALMFFICTLFASRDNSAENPGPGWGDSSKNGRPQYTTAEVEEGVLDDKTVFNSVSDNPVYGDEKYFVSMELVGGNGNWQYFSVPVEDGQTYILREMITNNGGQASTGTRAAISLPSQSGTEHIITGLILSSNASPDRYWNSIELTSDQPFHIEYNYGMAELESDGLGLTSLSDEIVTKAKSKNGVEIGYDALNGEIPGGAEVIVSIQIRIVMDEPGILTEAKIRQEGDKEWGTAIQAKVGDELQFQFHYTNVGNTVQNDVIAGISLPKGIELVPNTTYIYNSGKDGEEIGSKTETLTNGGINIGNYSPGADAYVRCTVKITSKPELAVEAIRANFEAGSVAMWDSCILEITD